MKRFASLALLALSIGCGGGNTSETAAPKTPAGSPPDMPNASGPRPITSLRRQAVRDAIGQGVGAFLQNVTLDDWPVKTPDGKFVGFKLRSLNSDWLIDLKPGDVVTKVNGIAIEHPEDADAALRSLEKASSLRVDFERDGKAKTLELPIVD